MCELVDTTIDDIRFGQNQTENETPLLLFYYTQVVDKRDRMKCRLMVDGRWRRRSMHLDDV